MARNKGSVGGCLYGVGITDMSTKVDGKSTPAYTAWFSMLRRVYGKLELVRNPTYVGCSVDATWLRFSVFKRWFDSNSVHGYHLDKDLLVDGNKVYGPKTCCFVPHALNCLFTDSGAARGKYPIGVSRYRDGTFHAQLSKHKQVFHLGYFESVSKAHDAWLSAKKAHVRVYAKELYAAGLIPSKVYRAVLRKGKALK